MVVWSHSSADASVADTTYFGIALSRSAIGPVWSRHARARPCQVSRGSSSASAASARSSAPCRPASLMYGKSASAGGASMTPSSVACVCAVIEVMRAKTARRRATHRSARNRRPGVTSRRVEHAVLEVPVALVRASSAKSMSKEAPPSCGPRASPSRQVRQRSGACPATVASDGGCCEKFPAVLVAVVVWRDLVLAGPRVGGSVDAVGGGARLLSGGYRGRGVPPELQEVVRRGDQAPFRARGGSAAALEAAAAAVELSVGEHRLDHALALGVEAAAAIGRQDATHERVEPAVPAGPGAFALAGVGRDQHLDPALDERVHLD